MGKAIRTLVRRLAAVLLCTAALLWQVQAVTATYPLGAVSVPVVQAETRDQVLFSTAPASGRAGNIYKTQATGPGKLQARARPPNLEPAQSEPAAPVPAAQTASDQSSPTLAGAAEDPQTDSENRLAAAQTPAAAVPNGEQAPSAAPADPEPSGAGVAPSQPVYAPQAGAAADLYIMVCLVDQLGQRTREADFSIYTPSQSLTASAGQSGAACLGPLAPGTYTLAYPGGSAVFTLLENGAVACEDEACCGDGEYLALSQSPWCGLELRCTGAAASAYAFTVTTSDGAQLTRVVGFDSESPDEAVIPLTLLPPGPVTITRTDQTGHTLTNTLDLAPGETAEVIFVG